MHGARHPGPWPPGVDPDGLDGPANIRILGASSDHLVVDSGADLAPIGSEMRFQLNYSALLAAMTSPFVAKVFATDG